MIDDPPSKPAKDGRTAIRRFTLMLAPLLWCMGFCFCQVSGCDMTETLMKTITYTLSGLGGWLVFLFVWRPSHPQCLWIAIVGTNHTFLHPTVPPWPFWRMLGLQLIISILFMLLGGLIIRWYDRTMGIKPSPRSSLHSLSDDQVA
jgi:hypothetical protein